MATRKPTKPDTPDWSLSPQQQTAITLLVSGKNLQDTATALDVERSTVSKWVNHHAGFQAALNQRRQELWADLVDHLRSLAPKAVAVLARELDGETPMPAALAILRACGLANGPLAPSGPTDPVQIAAQMQLTADERAHAEEEAQIAIQRRHFDRMLSGMAADPLAGGLAVLMNGQQPGALACQAR
jgi:hypothetical protein